MKVLISGPDDFFDYGIECLLKQAFCLNTSNFDSLYVTRSRSSDAFRTADIVVIYLSIGELMVCYPEICQRGPAGAVIVIYDDNKKPSVNRFPQWLKNAIFIEKSASVNEAYEKICAIKIKAKNDLPSSGFCCQECHQYHLSDKQLKVAYGVYSGYSMPSIARENHMAIKTVSTHKRLLMKKFSLHSDYELFLFLNQLKKRSFKPNAFRELVECV